MSKFLLATTLLCIDYFKLDNFVISLWINFFLMRYNLHTVKFTLFLVESFMSFDEYIQLCNHNHKHRIVPLLPFPQIPLCFFVVPLLISDNYWSVLCSCYFAFTRISYVWIIILRFIHVLHIPSYCWLVFHYTFVPQFILFIVSPVEKHLGS